MTTYARSALLGMLVLATPASAQSPAANTGRSTPIVRVAKWGLLGAAAGLGYFALRNSVAAADAYDELRALCVATPSRCAHDGGSYPDPVAESLYDRARSADRSAQLGIFGGQASLLGSVALFIVDLRGDPEPTTIPYPGGTAGRGRTAVLMVRLAF
jgi:hypothetical protein